MITTKTTPAAAPAQPRKRWTHVALQALKHGVEPYRVQVGQGLTLVVGRGTKSWVTKYKIGDRVKLTTLGTFPDMKLAEAQAARLEVRLMVRDGRDPALERSAARAERIERNVQTFESMARAWHAAMVKRWQPSYAKQVLQRLEKWAFPAIGKLPIGEVKRGDVIELLERASASGVFMADLVRQHLVKAFADWVDRELITRNPAERLAERTAPPLRTPQPAVLEIAEARSVLAQFEASTAGVMLKLLHRFQALTGVRPTEAREARWEEFARPGEWRIPAERMKGRRGRKLPHTVFLSPQAEELLAVAHALAPADAEWVFPTDFCFRHQPYARCSLVEAMTHCLGSRVHVAHGWRASLRTVLGRRHRRDRDLIELMLAHQTKGAVERLYDRTSEHDFEEQLRGLWCEWADLLLEGVPSSWALAGLTEPNVVQFSAHRLRVAGDGDVPAENVAHAVVRVGATAQ